MCLYFLYPQYLFTIIMGDSASVTNIQNVLHSVACARNVLTNYDLVSEPEPLFGDGYTSRLFTARFKSKETGEITEIVIKQSRSELSVNKIFKNEYIFYRNIFPAFNKFQKEINVSKRFENVPAFYCGSTEKRREYISMENLKAVGFTLYDKTKYLDRKHLRYVFKIYGKFHALGYMFKKEMPERHSELTKDLVDLHSDIPADEIASPIKKSFSGAVMALDPENEKELYEKTSKVLENIVETFVSSSRYNGRYSCINHGDCWSNNLLFKYDFLGNIEDVKLLDFQLCRDTSPVHDLSYFLYSGASEEDFDNLDSYLKIYHDSFMEFAKELGNSSEEIFSLEVLKQEWIANAAWGVFMSIYLWLLKLLPKERISNVMNDNFMDVKEKYKIWHQVADEIHKSKEFKDKTTPILRHAVNTKIF